MQDFRWRKWIVLVVTILTGLGAVLGLAHAVSRVAWAALPSPGDVTGQDNSNYVVLAWNDLGMHCYNLDFEHFGVLPPYNTLWAQVIRVADPPEIVTTGITVTYVFTDNTYSVGKTNFWDYDDDLFGEDLTPNVGLEGKGLAGDMDLDGDHFVAEGIPLTEYRDSDLSNPYPYQLATVIVRDAATGEDLARTIVVAPVSSEMSCDNCHYDYGVEDIATGNVDTNILELHDQEEHTSLRTNGESDLCADCHGSNALGLPEQGNRPNVSEAMHSVHAGEVDDDLAGCYNCHPGDQTQCLRDVMSEAHDMDCIDCHGGMTAVSQNPDPWLNEPRCDDSGCHADRSQDQDLYRLSKDHGGLYCIACHDSPHAIAPSREANDGLKFVALQGHNGTLETCTVCHLSMPTGAGPHGIMGPVERSFTLEPDRSETADSGTQVVYTHTLRNTGNVSDTYALSWSSSLGWAAAPVMTVGGSPAASPVLLTASHTALITVTVTVPEISTVYGLTDTTMLTFTSQLSPSLVQRVVDTTHLEGEPFKLYLPLVLRD